ncbi:MAG: type IV pilus secretin PilQ [Candidatus Aminicenantes bacterium]|nr:type IV pilus secretin PilQ [Candidatus Aminicenantes bacterium]MDH5467538.1 type IV pilus secretin PilQ [Candidatus Aminicenantes bacterium]MDH5704646.1 type IV pilus secretin PilQ [Candidatus Aminicenantes bacterium]
MKKKKLFQLLFLFCFLSLLLGSANSQNLVSINKISVQSEELNTFVLLESSAPLRITGTYYSQSDPATIVIELDKVSTEVETQIDLQESLLIEEIKIEKSGIETALLLIRMREKVPYRFYTSNGTTVVELNRIQRTLNGYILTSATEDKLKAIPKKMINFVGVGIIERTDSLEVTAKLNEEAVSQVFALENPLRLVVDFFDTLYPDPTYTYPVQRLGIFRVRTGQFQRESPYTIARLVFDLSEPRYYTLDIDRTEIVASFSKGPVTRAIPAVPPVSKPEVEVPPKVEKPVERPPEVTRPPVTPEVTPPAERFRPRTIAEEETGYFGEIIGALRFKDADLEDVVLWLADFAGLNVVFDPDVRGTVTCDLRYVPWDQALDVILRPNKMGRSIEGNILRIAPVTTLTREAEDRRRLEESLELAGPVDTKYYELSYARARDIESLIRGKVSSRGELIIDERTNMLVITDVRDRFNLLEQLIAVLDTPTPQVSIEARVVEATSNFVRNLGIQWGGRGTLDPYFGNQTSLQFPNRISVDGALIPQGISTRGIGGPLGGYAINLPAPAFNSALGLSLANVMDTVRIDLALSALETTGQGKIISSPSVTTQNNHQAEIIQGRQIPVQTVANFTTSVQFRNAALELRATPQITAEGTIIMDVEIRNDAPDFANLVNGIPPITTQSARTRVMVPDGGTTVIGGIYRTEDSISRGRVPFLHKIPILGTIFKNFSRTKQHRELLIFITPRIIQ